jgi:hypothetical protein
MPLNIYSVVSVTVRLSQITFAAAVLALSVLLIGGYDNLFDHVPIILWLIVAVVSLSVAGGAFGLATTVWLRCYVKIDCVADIILIALNATIGSMSD